MRYLEECRELKRLRECTEEDAEIDRMLEEEEELSRHLRARIEESQQEWLMSEEEEEVSQQDLEVLIALERLHGQRSGSSEAESESSSLVREQETETVQEMDPAAVKPQRLTKRPWMPSRIRLKRRPVKLVFSSSSSESDPAWDPGAKRPSRGSRVPSRKKSRCKAAPSLVPSCSSVSCRSDSDTPWEPGIRMPERLQRAPSRNIGALSSSELLRGGEFVPWNPG